MNNKISAHDSLGIPSSKQTWLGVSTSSIYLLNPAGSFEVLKHALMPCFVGRPRYSLKIMECKVCANISYTYITYIYAYIHVRIPVNPQLERHTVNWTAIRQDRIGMYSPLSTAIGIKKCGFCRGNSKDGTYIYSRVLLYFTVLSFGYYMFNLSFTPNQTPIPTKPVVLSPPGRRASGRPGSEMNCNTLCRPQPQWPQRVW